METDNIAIVREAYENFVTGNIAGVLYKLADDVEWIDPGAPAIPYAGVYRGPAEVGRFFERLGQTTEVLEFEPREYVATGGTVGVFGSWRARARKTGREFGSDWAMYFRVRDGKLARFQAYIDTAVEAAAFAGTQASAANG